MRAPQISRNAPTPIKILHFNFASIKQIVDADTKCLADFIGGQVQARRINISEERDKRRYLHA
jgi:hypothetical protein